MLEYLHPTSLDVPVIEYIRHLSTTGAAGNTAAGTTKPAATLVVDKVEAAPARSPSRPCSTTRTSRTSPRSSPTSRPS